MKVPNDQQLVNLADKVAFVQMAQKIAHDIQSPIYALSAMLNQCDELPETKRIILKNTLTTITDIAYNILNHLGTGEIKPVKDEERKLTLCSDFLLRLVSEKKYQYQDLRVKFDIEIAPKDQFAFIRVQPSQFRRAVTNLISNAVDACKHKEGARLAIKLGVDDESVKVTVQDNGKGMTRSMVEKIFERTSFTEGKENGHGLGMMQVWDMVDYNEASLDITSQPGVGTSSTLTFPRAEKANWVLDEINIRHDDIIVVIDDDQLIHDVWDLRISPLTQLNPNLIIRHEREGRAALEYINSLDPEEKNRVHLLCDFELNDQEMNGLQIIEASEVERAFLVTSYYFKPSIQNMARNLGVKILPKQMASTAPLYCTQKYGIFKINVDHIRRDNNTNDIGQSPDAYRLSMHSGGQKLSAAQRAQNGCISLVSGFLTNAANASRSFSLAPIAFCHS